MLFLFPVQGNVAEVSIKKHVRAPPRPLGYNMVAEHREISEKVGGILKRTTQ